jgi:hypothetical protein
MGLDGVRAGDKNAYTVSLISKTQSHFIPSKPGYCSNNVGADFQSMANHESDKILKNHLCITSIKHFREALNDTVEFQDKRRDRQDTPMWNSKFVRICVGQTGTD